MATRLPNEHVAFRRILLQVYAVPQSNLCIRTASAMMAAPYLAGEKPSAKNTRQRESLDSSLPQLFREVQALEMN
jgi:hypothetical protein